MLPRTPSRLNLVARSLAFMVNRLAEGCKRALRRKRFLRDSYTRVVASPDDAARPAGPRATRRPVGPSDPERRAPRGPGSSRLRDGIRGDRGPLSQAAHGLPARRA